MTDSRNFRSVSQTRFC